MNLEEVISKDCIVLVDEVCTKETAVEQLIDVFYKGHIILDKKAFREDIRKRESEFCTYVGHETAIPHAISKTVQRAGIAFLKSKESFVYGKEDERVKLMFMLAIPEHSNEEHLRMLSLLATHLMHQSFREELIRMTSMEDIYQMLCSIQ